MKKGYNLDRTALAFGTVAQVRSVLHPPQEGKLDDEKKGFSFFSVGKEAYFDIWQFIQQNESDYDAKINQTVKDRFQEIQKSLDDQQQFVEKSAEILRSSFYSLPLMFNIVNELKANKVGPIPKVQTIVEGNQVSEKLFDAMDEGKEQTYQEILSVVKQSIQTNDRSINSLEKINKNLAGEFKKHMKWTETVDIDKIPPTRQVNLKDENEIELSHPLIDQTSRVFERAKASWTKFESLRERRIHAFKSFVQAFLTENEEFESFSNEFRKGLEHWQTCVTQAEFTAAKIRDHVLNDPDRIARASIEVETRMMRADVGKGMFISYLKFMEDVNKKMSSIEKTSRKHGETHLKVEEARGIHLRKNSNASQRKLVSLESELDLTKKTKEDMITQLRNLCSLFLNQVETIQDREMLKTAILSRVGNEYAEPVLGGLVYENLPPKEGLHISQVLPDYIPEDESEAFEMVEKPKSPNPKIILNNQEIKNDLELPPQYGDDDGIDEKLEQKEIPKVELPDNVPPPIEEGGEGGDPPEEFLCALTGKLMNDPVVLLDDGYTYERDVLVQWLETHDTSPTTGKVLGSKGFSANLPVKRLIEEFKASVG
eukprot:TRINITY_DN4140_c0_g1_i6.p1 TRINITY_DN4140_c0_g1~~TRINITY_DN4140_c0_g1_i6.p1  ORF type:complete len:598 (+),score=173.26 TRINITY_DN4140_c0_g1_i6:456-2249(+)